MQIEFEATYTNVDKERVRNILKAAGATLTREEFLQKRSVFRLPVGNDIQGGWLRVRDEGDKITMSLKVVDGAGITDQREVCLTVDDYQQAEVLLQTLGCNRKAYQETKREAWVLDGVDVTIDTWPFLEPFVEVEGQSEEVVKVVSEKLGFNWGEAKFCAVDVLYAEKYGVSTEVINNHTPKIIFDMDNPFLNVDS
jgi:adenylate cyclase class 2